MNYWLAQPNPTKYPIIEYYSKYGNPDTQNSWHGRYNRRVRRGDKVFCFKSKGNDGWRGVLSLEEVTCDATKGLKPFPHEEGLWIDQKERERLLGEWGFNILSLET
jgi:hypothetical protein